MDTPSLGKCYYIISSFLLLILLCRLQPSADCGPFRGQPFMYSVVNDTISDFNCDAQKAISFFGTAGFVVPVIVLLLWAATVTLYYVAI